MKLLLLSVMVSAAWLLFDSLLFFFDSYGSIGMASGPRLVGIANAIAPQLALELAALVILELIVLRAAAVITTRVGSPVCFNYQVATVVVLAVHILFTVLVWASYPRLSPINSRSISLDWMMYLSAILVVTLILIAVGKSIRQICTVSAGITIVVLVVLWGEKVSDRPIKVSPDKPNIILIGIDSLRADSVAQINSPMIDEVLKSAVVYHDVFTPIARTHGSLTSLLSGVYPNAHGVRFNLQNSILSSGDFLASKLADQGFDTIFAMDERRFSTVDESYGYQIAIGPNPSAAEFVLPNLIQNPVSLFIGLIPGSDALFAYRNLNRANSASYSPARFDRRILDVLEQRRTKPVFLHAHFTLPHYPMTWRQQEGGAEGQAEQYFASLERVGKQLDSLLSGLQENGLLENALVIFYSDHGESFDARNVSIGELDNENTDLSYGHGTNVLSQAQFRVPLRIQQFRHGVSVLAPRDVRGLRSLTQLHGYLLEELRLNPDGVSDIPKLSHSFLESSRVSPALLASQIDDEAVIRENSSSFVIRDRRVHFSPSHFESQMRVKQFAVVGSGIALAYYGLTGCYRVQQLASMNTSECMNRDELGDYMQLLRLLDEYRR